MARKIIQYATLLLIILWGGASLFVICGDEMPGKEMSQTMFVVSKIIALASLYGCVKFYKFMERIGILSEPDDEDIL